MAGGRVPNSEASLETRVSSESVAQEDLTEVVETPRGVRRRDRGEERLFEADEHKHDRTGAPLTVARHDRGLSTEIGHSVDTKGNTLSGQKRRQLGRIRREHKRG